MGNGSWVPFSVSFTPVVATVTVYLPQESTRYSSWVSGLRVRQLIALPEYSFPCDSPDWLVSKAVARCGAIGGKDRALEVADAGGWSHAYQEMQVVPGEAYKVTGELFPEKTGVCDGSVAVKWCSPSVVVCPGAYPYKLTSLLEGAAQRALDLRPLRAAGSGSGGSS